jgi:hypothetical protein
MRQLKELRPYCIPTTRIKPGKLQKQIKLNPSSRMMQERERNLLLEHGCQNGPWTAAKIEDSDKTKHPPGQVSVGRNEDESSRNAIAESISLLHRPRSPSHRRLLTSQLLSWDRYSLRLFLKKTNAQATNLAHANPHGNNNNREKPLLHRRRPAHMNAYAFVLAKTHGSNRQRKSLRWRTVIAKISTSPSPAELVRHSSYNSSALPEILPSAPSNLSLPSRPYFSLSFLIFFFFIPRL